MLHRTLWRLRLERVTGGGYRRLANPGQYWLGSQLRGYRSRECRWDRRPGRREGHFSSLERRFRRRLRRESLRWPRGGYTHRHPLGGWVEPEKLF
jgi:hypothetical protein